MATIKITDEEIVKIAVELGLLERVRKNYSCDTTEETRFLTINLTAGQIRKMADFAGFKVERGSVLEHQFYRIKSANNELIIDDYGTRERAV